MKFPSLAFIVLFLMMSCDSSTSVGTGGDFNTFTTLPTAKEFSDALLSADYGNQSVPKLKADGFSKKQIQNVTDNQSITEKATFNCPGGGIVNTVGTEDNLSGLFEANFSNCSTILVIGGKSYAQTLSGSISANTLQDATMLTRDYKVSLSGSGYIGFAAECDIGGTLSNSDTFTGRGSCIFRDATGNKIEGDADDLKDEINF